MSVLYDIAISKDEPLTSAQNLALEYMTYSTDMDFNIEKMVRSQILNSVVTGVMTGFPGGLLMLVTVPADLMATTYFNIRMVAAIAYMRGYDVFSDIVRAFVLAASFGVLAGDLVKAVGMQIAGKATLNFLKKNITGKMLTVINRAIGFRFITKFGSKGVINLVKFIPLVGAVVGGTFDGVACRSVAELAKNQFEAITKDEEPEVHQSPLKIAKIVEKL